MKTIITEAEYVSMVISLSQAHLAGAEEDYPKAIPSETNITLSDPRDTVDFPSLDTNTYQIEEED